jgi:hypothetical protein
VAALPIACRTASGSTESSIRKRGNPGATQHLSHDLGRQARTAHAEQDDVGKAIARTRRRTGQTADQRLDEIERAKPSEAIGDLLPDLSSWSRHRAGAPRALAEVQLFEAGGRGRVGGEQ